jgi:putative ABC transport system permease protein
LIVVVLTGGVVATTLATSGRTVASERSVLSAIDDNDLTSITILDDTGTGNLDLAFVQRLARLNTVRWVVGLGPVEDLRPLDTPGADPVAGRRIVGSSPHLAWRQDLDNVAATVTGTPGAVIGPEASTVTGLVDSAGVLENFRGLEVPIVGGFAARGPLAQLRNSVLIHDPSFAGPLRRITLQVENPEDVESTASALTIMASDPGLRIVVADDLARIRAAVHGELGGATRATVLQTLAAGLVLVAVVMYASLHATRRDFGRRRALGATRSQLVTIVLLHVTFASVAGAVGGAVAGSFVTYFLTGAWPGWTYPVAVSVLAVLTNLLAATVPAVIAARRDPVLALRVP